MQIIQIISLFLSEKITNKLQIIYESMATFNPVVRTSKEFSTVYILISHKSKSDYIKTGMQIHKSGVKDGKIVDYLILANCAILIKKYVDRMNEINSENMSVQDIKKFLMSDGEQLSFVKFANAWIGDMEGAGRKKSAINYRTAIHSLIGFCGKKDLLFSDITSIVIRRWIESLSETHRAKQMYPNAIKKMFEDGCLEYNDYDNNIIKVKNQPFRAVKIPFADVPDKRSVEAAVIRTILKVKPETAREELAHDMILLVFSLAGINAVDLYELPLSAFSDGKIKYNRSKTKSKRKDPSFCRGNTFHILLRSQSGYTGSQRFHVRALS
jgi:hypothetical protein